MQAPCSTCAASYWPRAEDYNFATFDQAAHHAFDYSVQKEDRSGLKPFEVTIEADGSLTPTLPNPDAIVGLQRANIDIQNAQYLKPMLVSDGVTYIKSPKGTGKTQFLRRVVDDPKISVLLVGHRKALLRQICSNLNLNCYLDDGHNRSSDRLFRYGVSLDSISKINLNMQYDYVLLDESEQVLSHLLSDTMEDKRIGVLHRFRHLVSRANRVIALDADLGWPTFRFLSRCELRHRDAPATIVINQYQANDRDISVYDSKDHLVDKIHSMIAEGKRCYVTSNSKSQIQNIFALAKKSNPEAAFIQITSDNSSTDEVQNFLGSVSKEASKYQGIFSSPSVSTGVDISFHDQEPLFHVFGIFEPLILTHFECDQQLSRVRHPISTSVYVSPSVFSFETDLDVVKNDVLVSRLMENAIKSISDGGKPIYDPEDPLFDLACSIETIRRASRNNLRGNFVEYKRQDGWRILTVSKDITRAEKGKAHLDLGAKLSRQQVIQRLMDAELISPEEVFRIRKAKDNNKAVPEAILASYERARMEQFYREAISPELITLDSGGYFRSKVTLYGALTKTDYVTSMQVLYDADYLVSDEIAVLPHRRFKPLYLALALDAAGVLTKGHIEQDIHLDSSQLDAFVDFVVGHKKELESVLGDPIMKDVASKPMAQLNKFLDEIGLKLKNVAKSKVAGKKIYKYGWDQNQLDQMKGIAAKRRDKVATPDPTKTFGY